MNDGTQPAVTAVPDIARAVADLGKGDADGVQRGDLIAVVQLVLRVIGKSRARRSVLSPANWTIQCEKIGV